MKAKKIFYIIAGVASVGVCAKTYLEIRLDEEREKLSDGWDRALECETKKSARNYAEFMVREKMVERGLEPGYEGMGADLELFEREYLEF